MAIRDWFGQREARGPESLGSGRRVDRGMAAAALKDVLRQGGYSDQGVIQKLYELMGREVYPFATEKFLEKSKEAYPVPWVARELVQNFVDHNPHDRGTLNGVRFDREQMQNGLTRFTITGDWPFENIEGLTGLHSDKTQEQKTAGGNGIGLKQTAVRLLRDLGASKFQVQGEGWAVDYRMVTADQANEELRRQIPGSADAVRHNWVLAEKSAINNKGTTRYIIEAEDPETIAALDQLPTLGVSAENPYLANPNFESKHGAIKWLLPNPDDPQKLPEGRLFINGQVMGYRSQGETPEYYWRGPEGVSISLKDLDYKISIDRPPVSEFQLSLYLAELINSMSKEDILKQVHASEMLWRGKKGTEDPGQGYLVVLKTMLNSLQWREYEKTEYDEHFADRKYLCHEKGLGADQIRKLEEQGYTICPAIFEALGMPRATSVLEHNEAAGLQKPEWWKAKYKVAEVASEAGQQVTYESLDISEPSKLISLLRERLGPYVKSIEARPGAHRLIVHLNEDVVMPKGEATSLFSRPTAENRQFLHFVRGLAAGGLDGDIIKDIYLTEPEFTLTFSFNKGYREEGELWQLVGSHGEAPKLIMEFDPKYYAEISQALSERRAETESDKGEEVTKESSELAPAEGPLTHNEPVLIEHEPQVAEETVPEVLQPGAVTEVTKEELAKAEKVPGFDEAVGQVGESKGEYLDRKGIAALVSETNQAPVEKGSGGNSLSAKLRELGGLLSEVGHGVEDLEVIFQPSERQLKQLELLRRYVETITGGRIPNELLIYRGRGATGFNASQDIGLHETLLNASWREALQTLTHEIAHNASEGHGDDFVKAQEALNARIQNNLLTMVSKMASGEPVSERERVIAGILQEWERLRSQAEQEE